MGFIVDMPAKSKKQQMAAGAALSAKRGKRPKSSLKGASKSMVESMNQRELRDLAGTKRKSLPRSKNAAAGKKKTSTSKPSAKKAAPKRSGAKRKSR